MVFGEGRRGFLKKTPSPAPFPQKLRLMGRLRNGSTVAKRDIGLFHVESALPNEGNRRPLQRHKNHLAALSNAGTSVSYTLILYNFKVNLL